MPFDPTSAQPPVIDPSVPKDGDIGFAAPVPTDMRFANDHNTLAPHQEPTLPSSQIPTSVSPQTFLKPITPPVLPSDTPVQPTPVDIPKPIEPTNNPSLTSNSGQQVTLTITTGANQSSSPTGTLATPVSPIMTPAVPAIQINVQSPSSPTPNQNSNEPIPLENEKNTEDTTTLPPPTANEPRKLRVIDVARWIVILGLSGIGMRGFFDSLYFILVEFQNFEKALEDNFIETTQVNPLVLKAGLLVFTTALSIFFSMQLTMIPSKKLRWFRIFTSIIVGIACTAVIQHANTINVLDTFKAP